MDEPADETGEDVHMPSRPPSRGRGAQPASMPDQVAVHLRSWARTIDRWTAAGQPCFLITEEGLQPATPEGVADAAKKLRKRRQSNAD